MRIYQSHDGDEDWIVELDHRLIFRADIVGESGTLLCMTRAVMERYEALTADEQLELIEGIMAELQCLEPDTELGDIRLEFDPWADPPEWLLCDNSQLDEIVIRTPEFDVYSAGRLADGNMIVVGPNKRWLNEAAEFYRKNCRANNI